MQRYFLAIAVILITIGACKKSETPTTTEYTGGVWVEKSLRLDTVDFTYGDVIGPTVYLRSQPYMDTVLNPNYPVTHATMYSYILKCDSIRLRNFLSSSSFFQTYPISFAADKRTFIVAKFYNRRVLPAVILFEKIK